jgi:hypothetical protein
MPGPGAAHPRVAVQEQRLGPRPVAQERDQPSNVRFPRNDRIAHRLGDVVDRNAMVALGPHARGSGRLELRLDQRHEVTRAENPRMMRHLEQVADVDQDEVDSGQRRASSLSGALWPRHPQRYALNSILLPTLGEGREIGRCAYPSRNAT